MVGGPASGAIMQHLGGLLDLKNWQWLFLIEGMLPVAMGIAAFFVLKDHPRDADWLSGREKDLLIANLRPRAERRPFRPSGLSDRVTQADAVDRHIRLLLGDMGRNGSQFLGADHHPSHRRDKSFAHRPLVGGALRDRCGRHAFALLSSDRRLERHWHFFAAVVAAGCAAITIAYSFGNSTLSIACLAVLAIGYLTAIALFWTIPTGFLSETESAGGIAFISSAGQIGSLIAPVLFGYVSDLTGNLTLGVALSPLCCLPAAARS